MPAAHRKADLGSGHGCHFAPFPVTGGSRNVFTNGRPTARMGDAIGCGRVAAEGSPTVFIGDAVAIGGDEDSTSREAAMQANSTASRRD